MSKIQDLHEQKGRKEDVHVKHYWVSEYVGGGAGKAQQQGMP